MNNFQKLIVGLLCMLVVLCAFIVGHLVMNPGGSPSALDSPATIASAPVVDLLKGLVFDGRFTSPEVDDLIRDETGNGNNVSVHGPSWVVDEGRGAYQFKGSDFAHATDALLVKNSDSLKFPFLTASLWIKTTSTNKGTFRILEKDYASGFQFNMDNDPQDKPDAPLGRVKLVIMGHTLATDDSLADGNWHHLAGVFDGVEQGIYVDGKKQKQTAEWSGVIKGNVGNLEIGNSQIDKMKGFDGKISDVSIYRRALSADEVNALFQQRPKTPLPALASLPATPPPDRDLKKGLVLLLSIDQQPVNQVIKDTSGSGNDGRVSGAVWQRDPSGRGVFTFSQARQTDAITVMNSPSLNVDTITLSAWIQTSMGFNGPWRRIFDKDKAAAFCMTMDGTASGYVPSGAVSLDVSPNVHIFSGKPVNDGKWHHVVATYDGSESRLFVDGALEDDRRPYWGTIGKSANNLIIGNDRIPGSTRDGGGPFDGKMGEIRVYNRPLTPDEVNDLFKLNGMPKPQ